ncbi:MAG TPA: hypothetical protein G4O00_12555 [Thermoflexia bacterium]|jgi:hypothetical protein|nr:hypothetical protein [Thermoflexia bacterium]
MGLFGGAPVEVSIALDRPEGPYYPGDAVQATITIRARKKVKVSEVRAGLILWEKYIYYDTDAEGDSSKITTTAQIPAVVESLLDKGAIPAGFERTWTFQWQIPPDAPPPYVGVITKNRWIVKVTLDRRLRKDINAEVEVPLIVPPPGEDAEPGEYGDSSHPDTVDLSIWLPRLEWVEGETVEGKLLVRPEKDFTASEVRVELVREEYVPRGEGNRHRVVEGKAQLAGRTSFRALESYEYPFAFPIPVQSHPTRETPNSVVTWTLKGVLSRRLRKDFRVDVEIFVYNGRAPVTTP